MARDEWKSCLRDLKTVLSYTLEQLDNLECDKLDGQSSERHTLLRVARVCRGIEQPRMDETPPPDVMTVTCAEPLQHKAHPLAPEPAATGSAMSGNKLGSQQHSLVPKKLDSQEFPSSLTHNERQLLASIGMHDWHPLQRPDLARRNLFNKVRFFWIGITNNAKLREVYLSVQARVEIMQARANAITAQATQRLKNDMHNADVTIDGKVGDQVAPVERYSESHADDIDIAVAVANLKRVEEILKIPCPQLKITTDELFLMASCPFDEFINNYIHDRDDALGRETTVERRMELVKAVIFGVAGLESLSESLKAHIDANDQMIFKAFLLFLNLCTCIGQYVFHHYISPSRIYKCKME